jgi:pre-mRNA processing factor 4 (PRP4) like
MGGPSSERARAENQALLEELERKKKASTMAVPTDDGRVRARLRQIGEPITLFGERVRCFFLSWLVYMLLTHLRRPPTGGTVSNTSYLKYRQLEGVTPL